jgi:hypothetical protein
MLRIRKAYRQIAELVTSLTFEYLSSICGLETFRNTDERKDAVPYHVFIHCHLFKERVKMLLAEYVARNSLVHCRRNQNFPAFLFSNFRALGTQGLSAVILADVITDTSDPLGYTGSCHRHPRRCHH